jgi:hypothetical protein
MRALYWSRKRRFFHFGRKALPRCPTAVRIDSRVGFKEPHLLAICPVIVIDMFMVGILFGFVPVDTHSIGYSYGNWDDE